MDDELHSVDEMIKNIEAKRRKLHHHQDDFTAMTQKMLNLMSVLIKLINDGNRKSLGMWQSDIKAASQTLTLQLPCGTCEFQVDIKNDLNTLSTSCKTFIKWASQESMLLSSRPSPARLQVDVQGDGTSGLLMQISQAAQSVKQQGHALLKWTSQEEPPSVPVIIHIKKGPLLGPLSIPDEANMQLHSSSSHMIETYTLDDSHNKVHYNEDNPQPRLFDMSGQEFIIELD